VCACCIQGVDLTPWYNSAVLCLCVASVIFGIARDACCAGVPGLVDALLVMVGTGEKDRIPIIAYLISTCFVVHVWASFFLCVSLYISIRI